MALFDRYQQGNVWLIDTGVGTVHPVCASAAIALTVSTVLKGNLRARWTIEVTAGVPDSPVRVTAITLL